MTATTSSAARTVGRVAIVAVLAYCAVNATSQALNEAKDILRHAPEPMPAVMLFQVAVCITSSLSAIGIWRRTRWASRAIITWGIVAATFVGLLQPLLALPLEALPGLLAGSVVLLGLAALFVWFVKRDQLQGGTSTPAAPVHDRQERM